MNNTFAHIWRIINSTSPVGEFKSLHKNAKKNVVSVFSTIGFLIVLSTWNWVPGVTQRTELDIKSESKEILYKSVNKLILYYPDIDNRSDTTTRFLLKNLFIVCDRISMNNALYGYIFAKECELKISIIVLPKELAQKSSIIKQDSIGLTDKKWLKTPSGKFYLSTVRKAKEAGFDKSAWTKDECEQEVKDQITLQKWNNSKAGKIYKKHPDWSIEDCERLANRRYWIGMTIDMLKCIRGTPNSANPSNYGSGTNWQWCWYDYSPSCFYGGSDGIITSYN